LAYVGPGQTVAVDFGNRQLLDYGDAPGPFLTLKSANGARHHVVPRYCLGSNIDLEPEGQPHPAALGDDLNPTGAPNDEDGVRFLGPPVPGTMAQVEVTVNMATMNGQSLLQAWIDFDGDQDWSDPAEQIFTDVPLTVGPNVLSFLVSPETVPGTSMARFRLSTQAGLAFAGEAPDGEVEDYGIEIDPPLASIDLEKFTEGDDADTAPGPTLVVGDPVEWTYQVKNTGNVPLSNIQVTDDHGVVVTCPWTVLGVGESMVGQATGTVVLGQYGNVGTVTARALDGSTVSDTDSSHYLGAATPMDYGDAPDPPYPTLLASNGARHRMVPGGVRLGARLDGEAEGQPTAGADGDDRVRSDDEDGVRFLTPWVMGNTAAVEVLSDWGSAYLNAWADWNQDGDWADAGEQIVTNQWLTARLTTVSVLVPKRIAAGACVVRFRLSTQTRVSFDGEAADGEVEDYVREVREGGGIAGVKFDDWDGDGERDANEPGLAGWTIFLDADGDGQKGAGELAMTTGADGAYGFAGLIPGVYWVAEVPQAGWVANQTQLPYEIHRVSQSATGEAGNHSSVGSTLSADGRFVAFQSWADNLLGAGQDNNQCSDVFVVDRLNKAIQRVSQSASGEAGNQVSYWPSLSADGRFVAFASLADNLLEAGQDNNQCSDVFVVDRLTGAIQRVSQSGTGEAGNLSSQSPSLSADGRFVAFHSRADNLLGPGQDTNHRVDAFVVDRLTGAIQRVSQSASGEAGNGDSWYPSLSADGRFVAFVSYADNLLGVGQDMNQRYDVFVVDRWTEAIQRVSQSASGEAGNGDSESPSLSADGQFVAFDSWANNLLGVGQDINNRRDVFMADRLTGAIQRVSQSTNKDPGNEDSYSPSLSADGQFVAFDSWANNLLGVGQDINNRRDVFMVDRLTGAIQRVSQSASGETGNGDSWYPSLSADGRFIAFHSAADNLLGLGQDNNQCSDVFVVSTSKPIDGPRIVVLPSGQTVAVDFGNQQLLDYGDAPAPYPTLRGDDGARHHYNPEVYLGYALDLEPNGQPNGGDDLNPPGGPNDEDGVLFKGGMVQGPMASVEVIASIQGYLNACIDFNGDGDWDDADEQLFQDMIIGPGKTPLSFPVPADAVPQSHARFRLSTQPGLSYFGEATDGEVEDYVVEIAPRGLINGGAEMGSLDGWTGSSGMVAAVTEIGQATGTVRPKEGAFFFSLAQQPGSEATLTQTGLLRPGFSSLHLSGYFLSERLTAPEADDFGEVVLAVLDAEGNVLAEVASGPLVATENLRWEAVLLTSSVPEQAVTWKVQLCGVGRAGDRLNVYYDGWLLEYRNADSSYAAWASAQIEDPAQRDEGDDADGDGLVNLIEFAMELDPQVPESLGEVFWLTVGSEGLMTGVDVFFRQSKFSAGVSMEVRHTPDLAQPFSARLGGGPFVAEDHGDYVIQRIQFTDGAKAGGFFQLIVRPD